MSEGKYYWLKLQKDFFKRHDIKIIENMPNGKDYIIFYLKLLCESTAHEGSLRFSEEIPYSEEMLSIITDTNIDTVRSAIAIFKELKMIDVLNDGTFFLKQVEKMIGSESKWAKYKRKNEEIGKFPTQFQKQIGNVPIEIEKEKEIELEKDILDKQSPPYQEIISYLNKKTGKKFRVGNDVKRLIKARFNDKFTKEDFFKVIDNKCNEWLSDSKMKDYLRPQTLFGTKFDSYLNSSTDIASEDIDNEYDDSNNPTFTKEMEEELLRRRKNGER